MNKQRRLLFARNVFLFIIFVCFGVIIVTEKASGLLIPKVEKKMTEYLNTNYSELLSDIKSSEVTYDKTIYKFDPFKTLDFAGVGALMKMAKDNAKRNIEMGICGEHGGDEASIMFAHSIGLDYVSCSPYRIPAARLTSAQAAIKSKGQSK